MEDVFILNELKRGNQKAFNYIFDLYYKDLLLFGGYYIHEKEVVENIVQNIFMRLWADRETMQITSSLKYFLIRSVKNGCLDEWRHRQVIKEYENYTTNIAIEESLETERVVLYSDLMNQLNEALEKLPQNYREAFCLHRFEGLKYKEIAQQLQVSERTVEVRIGKALELLREYLKDFLLLIILFKLW